MNAVHKIDQPKLLLMLTFLLSFAFLPLAEADTLVKGENCEAVSYSKGKLWEVRKGSGPKSYIFGTMHSRDPRILYMPGIVMQALNSAQHFMMETTLSESSMQQSRRLMMAPHGLNMREELGETRVGQLKDIAPHYKIPLQNLLQLKIWAIASVLSQPPSNIGPHSKNLTLLDRELEKIAKNQNKKIIPLEKAADQLGLFDALSKAAQLELLDSALEGYSELEEELETLTQHYVRGNIGAFFCKMEDDLKIASPEIREFVFQKLLIDRNHKMVAGILKNIPQTQSFVAIGALHLPGKEGVLSLLEQQGFSIRKRF